MVSKCFVPGCITGYDSDVKKRQKEGKKKLSLFRPPKAEDKLEQWKKAISRPDRELGGKDWVCELHFLPEQISRHYVHKMPDGKIVVIERERATLVNDVVPSIFPNQQANLSTNNKRKRKCLVKKKPLSKKGKRGNIVNEQQEEVSSLFVDKMHGGKIVVIEKEKPALENDDAIPTTFPNSSKNKRNIKAPVKRILLSKKIKRENTDDTQQEEISSPVVDELPDSKIAVIEREEPTLMTNTAPTIHTLFPNFPSILTKNNINTISPFIRIPLPKRDNTDNTQPEVIIGIEPQFSFNVLLENLSQVSKPHNLWAVSSHENCIVCVKWNSTFDPERQIIIDADLGIKIKYYGTEVPIVPNTVIESVESLSLLLKEVDQYIVCPGAAKRNINCYAFVKRQYGSFGRPRNWCEGCIADGSRGHLKENTSRPCFRIYRNCKWFTSDNQKNALLQDKD